MLSKAVVDKLKPVHFYQIFDVADRINLPKFK